ncbi:hypothetical protein [Frondihabitans peucedani]|uniref:Glycosyltransferase RgtA/B/C/D-like domain-containing protein n=1 Tax=Frondihabitans peucedani TaxID=598626 RepID=A0ABP8DZK9_9MICO
MIAILTVALAALLSLVVGLPWAVAVRRDRDDWASLVIDSVAAGLLLLVTGLSVYSWIGVAGLVLAVLVELAVVAFIVTRRRQFAWPAAPVRREIVWIAVLVVILAVALLLRRHPSDFVEYTGDMGAYTNWADQFLRTGTLQSSWPPVFSMFLVLGGLLTGASGVTAIVPLTGLVLILVTVRLLRMVGIDRWIALVVGAVVAVHPTSIWFSTITLSESLNAPLLVFWLIAIIGVVQSTARRQAFWAALGGITMLALSLLRGTAPVLILPVVVVAVIALVEPRWRHLAAGLWAFILANGVGAAIGYWYGIDRIQNYYVDLQIRELLPKGLFQDLRGAGLLRASVASAVAAVAVVVVLAAAYLLVRRLRAVSRAESVDDDNVGVVVRIVELVGAAALIGAVLLARHHDNDVWQILNRQGIWFVRIGLVAAILVAVTRHTRARATLVIAATMLGAVFVVLQNGRLAEIRPHIVFLYWDRYLYSEFFPILMILVGVAFGTVFESVSVRLDFSRVFARPTRDRKPVSIAGPVVAVIAAALVLGLLPRTALLQENTELQGAQAIQTQLEKAMPDRDQTVLWGATAVGIVPGSGFPNTWQALGLPLKYAYGYPFDNGGRSTANGALPDVVLGTQQIDRALACARSTKVYVVESDMPGGVRLPTRLAGSGLDIARLDTVSQDVSMLMQPPTNNAWQVAHYDFTVYRVTSDTVPAASLCTAPKAS